ncbi:collagenase [Pelomonas sp. CA6]|uniref:collagenase n=1 Tax=Pelomonas sp. CA6 TaxID=2907999 RepID=UPI001F4C4D19|nr:collagenase [Pelomonas sp. CA6]MCH7345957.1 collagenase [Pelomonas sp. CA6]
MKKHERSHPSPVGPAGIWRPAALALLAALTGCGSMDAGPAGEADRVLTRRHVCSPSLLLRSEALDDAQSRQICAELAALESRFHDLFATRGRPVPRDGNVRLRANIYASVASFRQHAGRHFDMPVDNGGMYLEGLPDRPGNQAEFVANQRPDGTVRNLGHEYVHYLDGRYNLYGDFCAVLHDSHAPPENCPRPAPLRPYLVWWTEGVAEFLVHGANHPRQREWARARSHQLSELFDTGYESANGAERIYGWGYLAVRFMMERHRGEIDRMLAFTRVGDYPRYQALVREWGTTMDAEFDNWLRALAD